MNLSIDSLITLFTIAIAVILLASNKIRPDLVALMVLLTLGLSGTVDSQNVFAGFSTSAVMTILAISMISVGLQQTGATNAIGKMIHKLGTGHEALLILLIMVSSAVLSLFMNNIAAVGVLLPAIMSLSRRSKIHPSRLLMPLAFGTILGGMATLLTTSNIIVSGALKDAGFKSFGLLDYFPIGAPVALAGILYMVTIGKRLLPFGSSNNPVSGEENLTDRLIDLYELDKGLKRIIVLSNSPLSGLTIEAGEWAGKHGLFIIAVLRKKSSAFSPGPEFKIFEHDVLIVNGEISQEKAALLGLELDQAITDDLDISDECYPLAEIVISPHSRLIGKAIKEVQFRDQYSLSVVGVWRGGQPIHRSFSELKLQFGDALLVQGQASQIHSLQKNPDLIVLEEDPDAILLPRKGLITIIITLITLSVAALGVLPVAQVVLAGAVLLVLSGCMNINDAFHGIEWKAIFLIAGLWPLSIALQETGITSLVINTLLGSNIISPLLVTIILMSVSVVFTLVMSGQVSSIIMAPLALAAANQLGLDPRPFAMAVAMACSLAFITPLGHPVNILVMNPGGYSFKDYFRVGFPLTIIAFILVLLMVHLYWGL